MTWTASRRPCCVTGHWNTRKSWLNIWRRCWRKADLATPPRVRGSGKGLSMDDCVAFTYVFWKKNKDNAILFTSPIVENQSATRDRFVFNQYFSNFSISRPPPITLNQGWAINFARGALLEGRVQRGPHLLMEIEASLWQVSLSTKLEELLDLNIFSECFRGPLKTLRRATCGPWAANCPPLP